MVLESLLGASLCFTLIGWYATWDKVMARFKVPPRQRLQENIPMIYSVNVDQLMMQIRRMRHGTSHHYAIRSARRDKSLLEDAEKVARMAAPVINVQPAPAGATTVSVGPIELTPVKAAELTSTLGSGAIYFKPGEPDSFNTFGAQSQVIEDLKDALGALKPHEVKLAMPQLFLGPAGTGKSLVGKVLANELNFRGLLAGRAPIPYFLKVATDIETSQELDELMREANDHPGCVLFIDEIHDLPDRLTRKLYYTLEEHQYDFGQGLVRLNPFTIIGATTDTGKLPAPLRRRWVRHQFVRSTPEQIKEFVRLRARTSENLPIAEDALELLVSRTHHGGAPWYAIQVYNRAIQNALRFKRAQVGLGEIRTIIDRIGIDEQGLDAQDRDVLRALFTQRMVRQVKGKPDVVYYRASEQAVVQMAGLDPELYRTETRPKLMQLGYLRVRGGQELTEKAITIYQATLGA